MPDFYSFIHLFFALNAEIESTVAIFDTGLGLHLLSVLDIEDFISRQKLQKYYQINRFVFQFIR